MMELEALVTREQVMERMTIKADKPDLVAWPGAKPGSSAMPSQREFILEGDFFRGAVSLGANCRILIAERSRSQTAAQPFVQEQVCSEDGPRLCEVP